MMRIAFKRSPACDGGRYHFEGHTRQGNRVGHAMFARLLNTSLSTVRKWEVGQNKPTSTALKLLRLVRERGNDAVA